MTEGIEGWRQVAGIPARQLLQQTFASCHDAVVVVARESREVLACNDAFERIFGYPRHVVCGRTTEFLYPDREAYRLAGRLSREGMEGGGTTRGECTMRTADGRLIPTYHAVSPIHDDKGRIIAAVSVIQDRTPWQRAEHEIAQNHERLATVFANLPGALARFELDEHYQPRVVRLEGALAANLVGTRAADTPEHLLHCLDDDASACLQQALSHSAVSGRPLDLSLRASSAADNKPYWLRVVSQPSRNQDGCMVWDALVLDVTREKATEENLRYLANHDSLTGLPSRSLFQQILEAALRDEPEAPGLIGVIAVNLDRFKYVNNALGIGAGDQLLVEVARRLESVVGPHGIVSRTGSDDFMLLVNHETAPEGLQPLLRRLSHQLRTPFVVGQEVLHLTACKGVSRFPSDAADAEGLMICADTALQRARCSGSGSVAHYDTGMTDSIVATATLESDLHQAIKHRLIEVHYQPKIDPTSFDVIGLEALARWQHPTRGAISPSEFIPLAEETGLIHAIGEQILYTACAQLKEWDQQGFFQGPVSINLSGRQLTEATSHQVQSILRETGLAAHRLELEITESALVTDTEQAQRMLGLLTEAGVGIALDDFGKGYSALSYLRRFPINTLKIDSSFITRIDTTPSQSELVGAIVAMARNLRMAVVVEGVETRAQLDALRRHGVDAIQGWYFSPALSAEAIEPLLTRGAIRPTGTAS